MNISSIREKIEEIRVELTTEYMKCIDKGKLDSKVIYLSKKLDKLILEYMMKETQ